MGSPAAGDAVVSRAEGIRQFVIKSGVTLTPGQAFVFTATDGEVDLPAGANAVIAGGIVRYGGTGNASGTVFADVYMKGFGNIVYAIAAAAIAAGTDVGTAATGGKTQVTTTAGAVLGYAKTKALADGDIYQLVL